MLVPIFRLCAPGALQGQLEAQQGALQGQADQLAAQVAGLGASNAQLQASLQAQQAELQARIQQAQQQASLVRRPKSRQRIRALEPQILTLDRVLVRRSEIADDCEVLNPKPQSGMGFKCTAQKTHYEFQATIQGTSRTLALFLISTLSLKP